MRLTVIRTGVGMESSSAGASAAIGGPPPRVLITTAAADLLARLQRRHGPVMFHQSGGCCDGSSPMCYPDGEFIVGDRDVLLGVQGQRGVDRFPDDLLKLVGRDERIALLGALDAGGA